MSAVLVLNAGSSTIKYRLGTRERVLGSGVVERIGDAGARLRHRGADSAEHIVERPVADHDSGFRLLFDELGHPGEDLIAIGHRIVHGGAQFTEPTLVDDAVLAELEELVPLAPLHNPAGTRGIEVARDRYPGVPQVAVFDTAFHHTMPARAHRYALPRELADRHRIRCYVGAYASALRRLDAVVFTAGVGEHDPDVRARVCAGLTVFGIHLDLARNAVDGPAVRTISAADSAVAVLVVPTDEEGEIARQTRALLAPTTQETHP